MHDNPFQFRGTRKQQRRIHRVLLLVLFCQLLSALIPRGMMPGLNADNPSFLVFCGAQNNPALLKLIHDDWQQRLADADDAPHDVDSSAAGHCTFSSLGTPALLASDIGSAWIPLSIRALPDLASGVLFLPSFPYLLGPQNKAPPLFLSA